jgi:hypothetical protein
VSAALDQLRDTLVGLHAGGLRPGLPPAAARTLVEALDRGSPLAEAATLAGLDPRLAEVAGEAQPSDTPALLAELARLAARLDTATRQLRVAGSYALALAVAVGVAAVAVLGLALPTLAIVPGSESFPVAPVLLVGAGVAVGLEIAMGLVVVGRVRVPWLSDGWTTLDRYAFVRTLDVLLQAGTPLPVAVRAAGRWGGGATQSAATGLARSLEAGEQAESAPPLLGPFETRMLVGAAASGAATETAGALAAQHQVAIERVLPDAVVRIQAVAVVLAGVAVLALGAAFFSGYSGVLGA